MKGNIYEKREKLKGALKLQWEIDKLRDQLADIRATGGVASSKISDMPRGTTQVLTSADLVHELEGRISELEAEKKLEAELIRRRLKDIELSEKEEKIMLNRYYRCLPWRQVAQLNGCSKTHVLRQENKIIASM